MRKPQRRSGSSASKSVRQRAFALAAKRGKVTKASYAKALREVGG